VRKGGDLGFERDRDVHCELGVVARAGHRRPRVSTARETLYRRAVETHLRRAPKCVPLILLTSRARQKGMPPTTGAGPSPRCAEQRLRLCLPVSASQQRGLAEWVHNRSSPPGWGLVRVNQARLARKGFTLTATTAEIAYPSRPRHWIPSLHRLRACLEPTRPSRRLAAGTTDWRAFNVRGCGNPACSPTPEVAQEWM
jgi:hypothetical protein